MSAGVRLGSRFFLIQCMIASVGCSARTAGRRRLVRTVFSRGTWVTGVGGMAFFTCPLSACKAEPPRTADRFAGGNDAAIQVALERLEQVQGKHPVTPEPGMPPIAEAAGRVGPR